MCGFTTMFLALDAQNYTLGNNALVSSDDLLDGLVTHTFCSKTHNGGHIPLGGHFLFCFRHQS